MSTRQVFYAILSLSLFLSFCSSETVESISTDMAMTNVQTQDENELYEADWVSLNRHTTPAMAPGREIRYLHPLGSLFSARNG